MTIRTGNHCKPRFKKSNKIQYSLNMKLLRKLENITSITIKGERNQSQAKALEEGKKILKKRDKHITSAEKYMGGKQLPALFGSW